MKGQYPFNCFSQNNKVANKTYLYTYDNAGNITSKLTFDYTTDDTSELTEDIAESVYTYTYEDANWGDRLSSYRGVSFTYDSLGNPTSYYNGTSYTMGWSKGRQLSVITKGSSNFGFTYDAEGRRTSKLSFSGRVIQYVWDGDLLIGEYVAGQETITYTYDASGSPVGFTYTDLTGYYEGGVPCTFLYRKNPQGDIIGIVDSSGNEFVKYNYDAWGNLISYTMHGDGLYSLHYNMAEGNSFRYRGYYYDRETGFYHLNSRYYDPAIGRFLNADGITLLGANGDCNNLNLFAYCGNNPVSKADPTGEFGVAIGVMVIGGLIGSAISAITSVATQELFTGTVNWKSVGVAAISGFFSGAIAASPLGITGQKIAGSIMNGLSYMADCYVNDQTVELDDMLLSVGLGFVSGKIGGAGANENMVLSNIAKNTKRTIARETRRANQKYAQKAIASAISSRNNKFAIVGWISSFRFAAGAGVSYGGSAFYNTLGLFPNAPTWGFE